MLLSKEKVFRDPIHRYITVKDNFIWQLVNTRAFQRLNNLHQLGGAYQIFHGAVHTRFGHSLGAYAMAQEIYEKVPGLDDALSEYERRLLLVAALLHDLGHGPYSHASEAFLVLHHEAMTAKIILEDQEIRPILDMLGADFATDVVAVLQKTYKNKLITNIISSQIDVDRMDYLLRDSYYAGVPYGEYDKDRIIRVMRVQNQQIVFLKTGIHVIENFMVSRYHMREQVYNNLKGRAFESLLKLSVERFKFLWEAEALEQQHLYQLFYNFVTMTVAAPVEDFLQFDDHMFMAVQHLFSLENDEVLQTIAQNIIHRKLPHVFEFDDATLYYQALEKIMEYRDNGASLGYYLDANADVDKNALQAVIDKKMPDEKPRKDQIYLLSDNHQTLHLASEYSPILQALQQEAQKNHYFIYVNRKLVVDKYEDVTDFFERIGL